MRTSLAVGAVCGVALGLGGALAFETASEPASAQRGGVTAERLTRIENNSSAAQRIAKNLQNNLGVYLTPKGGVVGLREPKGVIRQRRGLGRVGLPASTIGRAAITRAKLADRAVNSRKIATGGVTTSDLASGSVTSGKLSTGAVATSALANGAVTADKIAAGALGTQVVTVLSGDTALAAGEKEILAVDLGQYRSGYTWSINVGADSAGPAECRIVDQDARALGPGSYELTGDPISMSGAKLGSNSVATRARVLCSSAGGTTMTAAHLAVTVAPV